MIKSISKNTLIVTKILRDVFDNLYEYKSKSLIDKLAVVFVNDNNIDIDSFSNFLFYFNPESEISKLAINFHRNIKEYIKSNNIESIINLTSLEDSVLFPELWSNEELLENEKLELKDVIDTEKLAISNALNEIQSSYNSSDINRIFNYKINTNVNSLYKECYIDLCDNEFINTENIIYVQYKNDESDISRIYCYELMELIASLSEEPVINPRTGKSFPDTVVKDLNRKYVKEIKLFKYSLNKKNLA